MPSHDETVPALPPTEAPDQHLTLMSTPLRQLLVHAPVTASPQQSIRAVAELMRDQQVSSVMLVERGHLFGLVTDMAAQRSTSAVVLAGDIHRQRSLASLVRAAGKVTALHKHLAAAGASAHSTGQIATAITDAITSWLLHLGEARFGPAPVDFAWVAAGSQAGHGDVSPQGARDVRDALEHLSLVRIRHLSRKLRSLVAAQTLKRR